MTYAAATSNLAERQRSLSLSLQDRDVVAALHWADMAGAETADHAVPGDYPEGVVPKKDDVFIAIMGVTGAGKSTFISHCTEQEVQVGHSLQACQSHPHANACRN